jgi:type II secretory ATPase GspE/PulE/Tfp pilus assembly ATPase PilB-like protein
MGIEPYLVASTLEAVVAQRLVRFVCPECDKTFTPHNRDQLQKEFGGILPPELHRGAGCEKCQGIGYLGRMGIFEQMVVTEDIRLAITEGRPHSKIRELAMKNGMKTLREDGFRYILQGKTTVEELLRVTKDERSNGNS